MENIPIIIISITILIFLIYLHICKIKDDFSSPNPSPESNSNKLVNAELAVEINQDNYRKYKSTLDKAYGNVPKDINAPLTKFSIEEYLAVLVQAPMQSPWFKCVCKAFLLTVILARPKALSESLPVIPLLLRSIKII